MGALRVESLTIYPIKSLQGIDLEQVVVDARGLTHDRRWMLVDKEGGFLSQRRLPHMALCSVGMSSTGLQVSHGAMPTLTIPWLEPGAVVRPVTVWGDRCEAWEATPDANAWFTKALGMECALVYMPEGTERRASSEYGCEDHLVAFSDGYPLLVATLASLEDLNQRLERPLSMRRFRPNITISGSQPYEEDGWRRFDIGGLVFENVKPCRRCKITTVDPDTSKLGKEPLRTLATYRQDAGSVVFGQNAICHKEGTISVGDRVTIQTTQPPVFPA